MAKAGITVRVAVALEAEEVKRRIWVAFNKRDPEELTRALKLVIGLPAPTPGAVKVLSGAILFKTWPESASCPSAAFDRHEAAGRAAALLQGVFQVVEGEIEREGGK